MYIDVHTHLTDKKFDEDRIEVLQRAIDNDMGAIVVNGLEPKSNRMILEMANEYPIVKAALGIYPVQAAQDFLPKDLPYEVESFDLDDEIAFIRTQAEKGRLIAIGECGLDYYWLDETSHKQQEKVLIELLQIGKDFDLPLIIHSRKAERRCFEVLAAEGCQKVDFHCYSGKYKLAAQYAERPGWYFSIPANCRRSESFTKMLRSLPKDKLLTETDAPYLSAVKGVRSQPSDVLGTVAYFAELHNMELDQAREIFWQNYLRLFEPKHPKLKP